MLKVHNVLCISVVVLILWCCDAVNHESIKDYCIAVNVPFFHRLYVTTHSWAWPVHVMIQHLSQSTGYLRQCYRTGPRHWLSGRAIPCSEAVVEMHLTAAWRGNCWGCILCCLSYNTFFFSSCQCWLREQHTSEVKSAFTKPAVPAQWNVQWISPQVSDESDRRSLITFPTIFIYFIKLMFYPRLKF